MLNTIRAILSVIIGRYMNRMVRHLHTTFEPKIHKILYNSPAPHYTSPPLPQLTPPPQKLPKRQQRTPYTLLINMTLSRAQPSLQHFQLSRGGGTRIRHELSIVLGVMLDNVRSVLCGSTSGRPSGRGCRFWS